MGSPIVGTVSRAASANRGREDRETFRLDVALRRTKVESWADERLSPGSEWLLRYGAINQGSTFGMASSLPGPRRCKAQTWRRMPVWCWEVRSLPPPRLRRALPPHVRRPVGQE